MRAVVVRSWGEAPVVVAAPEPRPGPGQVLIEVAAAAVNPVDVATARGHIARSRPGVFSQRPHIGLGWDVAGTVAEAGQGVSSFVPGDAVIGLRDRLDVAVGTFAERVVLDAADVAPAPAGVDPAAAATIGLNALTAVQALDRAGLRTGQTLLVTGAAGGLGGAGLELAALRGLRVAGTASAADEDLVRRLGASWFVPRTTGLAEAVRGAVPGGVDAAFDAAALGFAAMDTIRAGGVYVSFVPVSRFALRDIREVPVVIHADGAALCALSGLAARGLLTPRVAGTYPLERAAEAFERLEAGGVRGRLVLVP